MGGERSIVDFTDYGFELRPIRFLRRLCAHLPEEVREGDREWLPAPELPPGVRARLKGASGHILEANFSMREGPRVSARQHTLEPGLNLVLDSRLDLDQVRERSRVRRMVDGPD